MSSQEPSETVCIIIHKTGVVLSDLALLTLSADRGARCSFVCPCDRLRRCRLGELRGRAGLTTGKEEGIKMKRFVKAPTRGDMIHFPVFRGEEEKENLKERRKRENLNIMRAL